ncbi:hypothetical protein LP7551_02489 [Roseibium album]|nr:hypothetical protein LP7551_02489 [Roseibium album]
MTVSHEFSAQAQSVPAPLSMAKDLKASRAAVTMYTVYVCVAIGGTIAAILGFLTD